MTYLAAHLQFPSTPANSTDATANSRSENAALPPPASHLLISDTLQSPATFTLYHLLHAAIAQKRPVIWVDIRTEGKKSLEAVLRRMSSILPKSNEQFSFIQPNSFGSSESTRSSPSLFDEDDVPTLKPLYDQIRANLQRDKQTLVILHGLSEILSIGFAAEDVHHFVRAVRSATLSFDAVLVSTLHADDLADGAHTPNHDLLERLLRSASGWWRVEELASGRSGDVHGEISSHALFANEWNTVPRSHPLQYRLEANTVKVFAKGTGRGYL